MIVNSNVGLLFIDHDPQYMKIVKEMLEQNSRLPGEVIYLVHTLEEGEDVLRQHNTIEMIVLHTNPSKIAVQKDLTRLRNVSLAEIMLIALFEEQDDISDIYRYGMNTFVPPIYKPDLAVAYFESFIDRHRHIPSINRMKEIVHIKDRAKMLHGDLVIDLILRSVKRSGIEINLTAMEYKLLLFMAQHANQLLTPDQIFDGVWESENRLNSDLSSRICRLRQKIEINSREPEYIITKYGHGYLFRSK